MPSDSDVRHNILHTEHISFLIFHEFTYVPGRTTRRMQICHGGVTTERRKMPEKELVGGRIRSLEGRNAILSDSVICHWILWTLVISVT